MSLNALTPLYPWARYSKKLKEKIVNLRSLGVITQEEADSKKLRLVTACKEDKAQYFSIHFYWLVDEEDGRLVDAKFNAVAQSAMLGALEGACLWIVGKSYAQVQRIGAEVIDKLLQDEHTKQEAFPFEVFSCLNFIVDLLEEMALQCRDIPLSSELSTPLPTGTIGAEEVEKAHFESLGLKDKLKHIKEVVDREIQPYVALDGGGVEVLNLLNDWEVLIAYQGACVGCFSSVGSTLNSIQHILQSHVHPQLIVKPQL